MSTPAVTHIGDVDGTILGSLLVEPDGSVDAVVLDINGTSEGGVFRVDPASGTATMLGIFDYNTSGGSPTSGVVQDSSGALYGTTIYGGANGNGAVYMVDETNDTLVGLASSSTASPDSVPVVNAAGDIFFALGSTEIDELAAGASSFTTLATVDVRGTLTIDAAGDIYGANGGGTLGYGSIFEIAAGTNTVTTLLNFDGSNGDELSGGLVLDAAGNIYGNAHNLFELAAGTHAYSLLANFSDSGQSETSQIAVDAKGDVFGTTTASGGSIYELAAGSGTITSFAADDLGVGDLTTDAKGNLYGDNGSQIYEFATCYCPGTLILTVAGERLIESLQIGDEVMTASGVASAIRWIGRSTYGGRFIAGKVLMLPVCLKADALGPHIPARDLWVSPGHGIFREGVLVPAWRLVNGVSVIQAQAVDDVTYLHIDLAEHHVILANGCPAESFFDDAGCRNQFHNASEFRALYPGVTGERDKRCAPRIDDGFHLDAIRRRIAARAGIEPRTGQPGALIGYVDYAVPTMVCGWALDASNPDEPVCLDVVSKGCRVGQTLANRYRPDLRAAGIGCGTHGFEMPLPAGLTGEVEVRRSVDGALLALTNELRLAAA